MRIEVDDDSLRRFIAAVVRETLAAVEAEKARLGDGRLAYTEPEAAELLGLPRHSLRDLRLRGQIAASRVGKRLIYSRDELLAFLARQRG